ncbi:sulfur carrier protein ThiS [Streptomyces sp. NPDC012623]|uniref:sulfur carrier protein ThiS n=1 Tax=unclassified Streptomyces TaxID=2593676 RepID=UPI003692465D
MTDLPATPRPTPVAPPRRVRVLVNGEPREFAAPAALDTVVAALSRAASGVAAAVNETVVPRSRWSATSLREGDRVEILTAVQGG